jgi:hypothetical protein
VCPNFFQSEVLLGVYVIRTWAGAVGHPPTFRKTNERDGRPLGTLNQNGGLLSLLQGNLNFRHDFMWTIVE